MIYLIFHNYFIAYLFLPPLFTNYDFQKLYCNIILDKASNNYAIFERVGYVYFRDGQGEGTPHYNTKKQRSNMIREYVGFLYFDYNFYENNKTKERIVRKLRNYNEKDKKKQLKNFISDFDVLNNLLVALIKDPNVNDIDKKYCEKLLNESKTREKMFINKNI